MRTTSVAFFCFLLSSCTESIPRYSVELQTLKPNTAISLGQVRNHPSGVENVGGVKLWQEYEAGVHELEGGSYFYRLRHKDGSTKQGLVAILEDGQVTLN